MVLDKWLALLTSGKSGEIEARLRRRDGVYRWFLCRAEPLRDELGQIVRWYGTNTDIHDLKRTEAKFREDQRELFFKLPTRLHRPWAFWIQPVSCFMQIGRRSTTPVSLPMICIYRIFVSGSFTPKVGRDCGSNGRPRSNSVFRLSSNSGHCGKTGNIAGFLSGTTRSGTSTDALFVGKWPETTSTISSRRRRSVARTKKNFAESRMPFRKPSLS